MNTLRYYIDTDKAAQKEKEESWSFGRIIPVQPRIKNPEGLYGDVGIDLFAAYGFNVPSGTKRVVDTFIGVVFDVGTFGMLWPRSGDDFLVGAGIIDTGYTGTIKVKIINPYKEEMVFKQGDSVGQLIIAVRGYMEGPNLTEISKERVDVMSKRGDSGRINAQFNL